MFARPKQLSSGSSNGRTKVIKNTGKESNSPRTHRDVGTSEGAGNRESSSNIDDGHNSNLQTKGQARRGKTVSRLPPPSRNKFSNLATPESSGRHPGRQAASSSSPHRHMAQASADDPDHGRKLSGDKNLDGTDLRELIARIGVTYNRLGNLMEASMQRQRAREEGGSPAGSPQRSSSLATRVSSAHSHILPPGAQEGVRTSTANSLVTSPTRDNSGSSSPHGGEAVMMKGSSGRHIDTTPGSEETFGKILKSDGSSQQEEAETQSGRATSAVEDATVLKTKPHKRAKSAPRQRGLVHVPNSRQTESTGRSRSAGRRQHQTSKGGSSSPVIRLASSKKLKPEDPRLVLARSVNSRFADNRRVLVFRNGCSSLVEANAVRVTVQQSLSKMLKIAESALNLKNKARKFFFAMTGMPVQDIDRLQDGDRLIISCGEVFDNGMRSRDNKSRNMDTIAAEAVERSLRSLRNMPSLVLFLCMNSKHIEQSEAKFEKSKSVGSKLSTSISGIVSLQSASIGTFRGMHTAKGLAEVYLQNNEISCFRGIGVHPKLRVLRLERNKITSLKGFENSPRLEELNLAGNPISKRPLYRLMCLIVCGNAGMRVDGRPFSGEEYDLANTLRPVVANALKAGFILAKSPPKDCQTIFELLEFGHDYRESLLQNSIETKADTAGLQAVANADFGKGENPVPKTAAFPLTLMRAATTSNLNSLRTSVETNGPMSMAVNVSKPGDESVRSRIKQPTPSGRLFQRAPSVLGTTPSDHSRTEFTHLGIPQNGSLLKKRSSQENPSREDQDALHALASESFSPSHTHASQGAILASKHSTLSHDMFQNSSPGSRHRSFLKSRDNTPPHKRHSVAAMIQKPRRQQSVGFIETASGQNTEHSDGISEHATEVNFQSKGRSVPRFEVSDSDGEDDTHLAAGVRNAAAPQTIAQSTTKKEDKDHEAGQIAGSTLANTSSSKRSDVADVVTTLAAKLCDIVAVRDSLSTSFGQKPHALKQQIDSLNSTIKAITRAIDVAVAGDNAEGQDGVKAQDRHEEIGNRRQTGAQAPDTTASSSPASMTSSQLQIDRQAVIASSSSRVGVRSGRRMDVSADESTSTFIAEEPAASFRSSPKAFDLGGHEEIENTIGDQVILGKQDCTRSGDQQSSAFNRKHVAFEGFGSAEERNEPNSVTRNYDHRILHFATPPRDAVELSDSSEGMKEFARRDAVAEFDATSSPSSAAKILRLPPHTENDSKTRKSPANESLSELTQSDKELKPTSVKPERAPESDQEIKSVKFDGTFNLTDALQAWTEVPVSSVPSKHTEDTPKAEIRKASSNASSVVNVSSGPSQSKALSSSMQLSSPVRFSSNEPSKFNGRISLESPRGPVSKNSMPHVNQDSELRPVSAAEQHKIDSHHDQLQASDSEKIVSGKPNIQHGMEEHPSQQGEATESMASAEPSDIEISGDELDDDQPPLPDGTPPTLENSHGNLSARPSSAGVASLTGQESTGIRELSMNEPASPLHDGSPDVLDQRPLSEEMPARLEEDMNKDINSFESQKDKLDFAIHGCSRVFSATPSQSPGSSNVIAAGSLLPCTFSMCTQAMFAKKLVDPSQGVFEFRVGGSGVRKLANSGTQDSSTIFEALMSKEGASNSPLQLFWKGKKNVGVYRCSLNHMNTHRKDNPKYVCSLVSSDTSFSNSVVMVPPNGGNASVTADEVLASISLQLSKDSDGRKSIAVRVQIPVSGTEHSSSRLDQKPSHEPRKYSGVCNLSQTMSLGAASLMPLGEGSAAGNCEVLSVQPLPVPDRSSGEALGSRIVWLQRPFSPVVSSAICVALSAFAKHIQHQ